jgi:hypothetical protein
VEGLDRRDFLYGGAVAVVFLIVPIVGIPLATSTTVSAWADRALDAERLNLRQNRPEDEESSARVADYYHQHGVGGPESSQMASTVLGGFARTESKPRPAPIAAKPAKRCEMICRASSTNS